MCCEGFFFRGGRRGNIEFQFVFVVQIPTILADNAGYDSADLVAQLKAEHALGNTTAGLGMVLNSATLLRLGPS